jgi:hypothetical protein
MTIMVLILCLRTEISIAAPYIKPDTDFTTAFEEDIDCCNEAFSNPETLYNEIPDDTLNADMDNLLYIPFSEATIRDFGIHKYVINRNIKTLMTYHTDSHLVNVIFNSINQSTTAITRLVMENRVEFDAMSKNEFAANFLDLWCAYRLIQLGEFSTNNLDIIANMFKDSMDSGGKWEL